MKKVTLTWPPEHYHQFISKYRRIVRTTEKETVVVPKGLNNKKHERFQLGEKLSSKNLYLFNFHSFCENIVCSMD